MALRKAHNGIPPHLRPCVTPDGMIDYSGDCARQANADHRVEKAKREADREATRESLVATALARHRALPKPSPDAPSVFANNVFVDTHVGVGPTWPISREALAGLRFVPVRPPANRPTKKLSKEEAEAERKRAFEERWKKDGPRMWAEFHRWTLAVDLSTPEKVEAAKAWLVGFRSRIGCGTCGWHWDRMREDHPLDFTSNEALFAGGVGYHNMVNQRIGKTEMPLEAARALWANPDACRPACACGGQCGTAK